MTTSWPVKAMTRSMADRGDDDLMGFAGNDTVKGGQGDDILIGDEGDDTLSGGDGDDTLHGNDGDDALSGGKGDDTLNGDNYRFDLAPDKKSFVRVSTGSGEDTLEGGKGDDILWGGGGADRFVFASGSGTDTVRDFEDGEDILVIRGGLAFSDLTIRQSGDDTVVDGPSDGFSIVLEGIQASQLTESDFDFLG